MTMRIQNQFKKKMSQKVPMLFYIKDLKTDFCYTKGLLNILEIYIDVFYPPKTLDQC